MSARERTRSPFLAFCRRCQDGLADGIASARDTLGNAVGRASSQLASAVAGHSRQPNTTEAVGQSIAPAEELLQRSSRPDRSRERHADAAEHRSRQPVSSTRTMGQSTTSSEEHPRRSSRDDRSRERHADAAERRSQERHARAAEQEQLSAAAAGVVSGRATEPQATPLEGAEDTATADIDPSYFAAVASAMAQADANSAALVAPLAAPSSALVQEELSSQTEGVQICVSDEESIGHEVGAEVSERAPLSVAEEHAECSICFEPLHSQPTVVLANEDQKRVCRHFFHETCARSMAASAGGTKCPLCRTTYCAALFVPDVEEHPRAWFQVVDLDGNGSLDCEEVGDVLKATLPVDCQKLDRMLPALCEKWSKGGRIGYEEMMGPGGLFFYVRDAFRSASGIRDAPDIREDPQAWFRYWDEDGSGSLNQEEVVRAVVKTFGLSSVQQIRTVRELLVALWSEFDLDGSGCIDKTEFCRPDSGLAQMIIANLA